MSTQNNAEPITLEVTASELPESMMAKFSKRPPADARLSITIAPVQTEAEKLTVLREDIQEGLADIKNGRVGDMEVVFARLKSQFPGT